MTLKDYVNAVVSASITGSATAGLLVLTDPTNVDWHKLGWAVLGGAVLGLLNHFRTPPGQTTVSK